MALFIISDLWLFCLRVKVHPAPRVPAGTKEVVASRERRVSLALLASLVTLDRKESLVMLESR